MTKIGPIAFTLFAVAMIPLRGSADPLVTGFGNIQPLHYRDASGKVSGFVIDVVDEAARRAGIQIVWRAVNGSVDIDRALAEGRIDVFPVGVATQARRQQFWVSEPWWSEDLSLLARVNIGQSARIDWRGRHIVLGTPAYLEIVSRTMPGARFDLIDQYGRRNGPKATAAVMCEGAADAALMAHSELDGVLLHRPAPCRDLELQIVETNEPLPLALIARPLKSAAAQSLKIHIDELARDGTLGAIARRYPLLPARSVVMLSEKVSLMYQRRLLWTALAGALLIILTSTILLLRQMRTQRSLRRAITERARTEQMLRDRTEELSLSNEELQAFAYSVSHDLQEPARTIRLYTALIERRAPPTSPEGEYELKTIGGAAARMQEMIEKLLLLSRVGRSAAEKVPVEIGEVLSGTMRDLELAIQPAAARITVGSMPVVLGWPDRLSVLSLNLISNALKYTRDGITPEIDITAVRTGKDYQFAVRDNGIGFEQEHAEKIFAVFKRLHGNDRYGGTGVGLAIAKRVVERHGGRIWAEGKPNQGSTFYFTLPVEPVAEVVEAHSPAASASESAVKAVSSHSTGKNNSF